MILTANSEIVRQTRRKTGNGWHTTFIGENRNTLKQGQTPPEAGSLYPMAFLVEKEPHAVTKPHFHEADQYQVIVQGGGRLGTHDVGTVAVHYTDAWSAYGPIVAADEGISWFTLRNTWDSGARYMPAAREQLRAARTQNFAHREATAAPMPVASAEQLARTELLSSATVIEQTPDGMATWRYRLPPGSSVSGPDPHHGGGQFWIVLSGSASAGEAALLPPNSCVFVAPGDGALTMIAGDGGAEALCMQFPVLARH
jgi:mannose-6-phosphate isomerase-like protein (cupin superfamily)